MPGVLGKTEESAPLFSLNAASGLLGGAYVGLACQCWFGVPDWMFLSTKKFSMMSRRLQRSRVPATENWVRLPRGLATKGSPLPSPSSALPRWGTGHSPNALLPLLRDLPSFPGRV